MINMILIYCLPTFKPVDLPPGSLGGLTSPPSEGDLFASGYR